MVLRIEGLAISTGLLGLSRFEMNGDSAQKINKIIN